MRLGEHKAALATCAAAADHALWSTPPDLQWDLGSIVTADGQEALKSTDALIERALAVASTGDSIVIMSNGGFDGLHGRLLAALEGALSRDSGRAFLRAVVAQTCLGAALHALVIGVA